MYSRKSTEPQFASEDYLERYDEDVVMEEGGGQEWYYGRGIEPDKHPLKGYINFQGCMHCESQKVKVIAAQWSVSYHSGDRYWDYEIVCEDCGQYTQRSFAEND